MSEGPAIPRSIKALVVALVLTTVYALREAAFARNKSRSLSRTIAQSRK